MRVQFVSYLLLFLVFKQFPSVISIKKQHRREKLNCTKFLPPKLLHELRNAPQQPPPRSPNSATSPSPSQASRYHVLPEENLLQCLKAAAYDRDVSAGADVPDFSLRFVFSLCEVLELRFDGTLRLWTQLQISWDERRLAWLVNPFAGASTSDNVDEYEYEESTDKNQEMREPQGAALNTTSTDVNEVGATRPSRPHAYWPQKIMYPADLLWSPLIRVLNCHSAADSCYVQLVANSSALLLASGEVTIRVPKLLEFSCNIDLFAQTSFCCCCCCCIIEMIIPYCN